MDPTTLVLRWAHILAAIVAMGGLVFARYGLLPALAEVEESTRDRIHDAIRRRWLPWVIGAITVLLVSGLANFLIFNARVKAEGWAGGEWMRQTSYHALFGAKFLLAMVVFYFASALVGRGEGTQWVRNDRAYASFYTQCTRKTTLGSCGGGVDGGVDDRFDYILVSNELAPRVVPGSYTAFGNDGVPRLNDAIDEPTNQRVSAAMAAALKCASDHLPVYVDVIIGDVQASVEGAEQLTPWIRLQGTTLVVDDVQDKSVAMLYDINGRMCMETVLQGPTARIDAGSLLPGVYALRVGSRWASFVMP